LRTRRRPSTSWGIFLFGGDYANVRPFAADGSTSLSQPPTGGTSVEFDAGQTALMHHDGMQMFVNSGAVAAIQRLSNGLLTDSDTEIGAALTDLTLAFERTRDLLRETGARSRQLEMACFNIESLEVNLRSLRL